MQPATEPVLEPDRHHDAGGKQGGEQIALLHRRHVAVDLLKQPIGIVTLGEADGRRNVADQLILLQ